MRKASNRLVLRLVTGVLPFYLFALSPLFTSCKEEDDTQKVEYPYWQSKNDSYFSNLVSEATAKINAGSTTWKLMPAFNKPTQEYVYQYYDYVVAEELTPNTYIGTGNTPYVTDSVEVHYIGRLLPSESYATGKIFDYSYELPYDAEASSPVRFAVGDMTKGFATAMLYMHRGDYWRIYVPYQLGYGSTDYSNIPAYSTLIFDVTLVDFWRKVRGDRDED